MMKRKLLVSVLLFCIAVSNVWADGVTRGFEALEVYNYFKAKSLFERKLDKRTSPAAYGLSLIHFRQDNPFTNTSAALEYILKSEETYGELNNRQIKRYAEYGFDSLAIQQHKQKVGQRYFKIAWKKSASEALDTFVMQFPWFERVDSVITLRDSMAYAEALDDGSSQSIKAFLNRYPYAIQRPAAKKVLEERTYREETAPGHIASYESYIEKYPEGPYVEQAMDSVYKKMTSGGAAAQYLSFIEKHPDYYNINTAWRGLYLLEVVDFTPEEITEFMLKYPGYPFKSSALKDFRLAQEIFLPFESDDGLWGFIDTTGSIRIPAQYNAVSSFKEGAAIVQKEGRVGFINKGGTLITPLIFDDAEPFTEGFAVVEKDGQQGLINRTGDYVVSAAYKNVGQVSNDVFYVDSGGHYFYLNIDGKRITNSTFNGAGDIRDNFAIVRKGEHTGVIDIEGNVILQPVFEWIGYEGDSIFQVRLGNKYGLLKGTGDTILDVAYRFIGDVRSNRRLVITDEHYGYVDQKGNWVIDTTYEASPGVRYFATFANGCAKVKRNDKVGLIDTSGQKVYAALFQDIGTFDSLFTPVKRYDKWGYADARTKLRIKYRFDHAASFRNGMAVVGSEGFYGLINPKGGVILPIEYKNITAFSDSLWVFTTDSCTQLRRGDLSVLLDTCISEIELVPSVSYLARVTFDTGKWAYFRLDKSAFIKPE